MNSEFISGKKLLTFSSSICDNMYPSTICPPADQFSLEISSEMKRKIKMYSSKLKHPFPFKLLIKGRDKTNGLN